MPFAFAMLICRARNALPLPTWHLTVLCMSHYKHTQIHKSFTFQVYSSLVEKLPVACLDMLGCVITCGVRVCLHEVCLHTGGDPLCLGGSLLLVIPMVQILQLFSHCASSMKKRHWGLRVAPGYEMRAPKYNETRQVYNGSMTNSAHPHFQPDLTLKSRFSLFWSQGSKSRNDSTLVLHTPGFKPGSALNWKGRCKPSTQQW